jgi:hypothetical protein
MIQNPIVGCEQVAIVSNDLIADWKMTTCERPMRSSKTKNKGRKRMLRSRN